MSRASFSLLLVLSMALAVSASRGAITKHIASKSGSGSGPNKCTISWKYRGQVASVSFGVKSCMIHCKATGEFRYDKVFPSAFDVTESDQPNKCSCKEEGSGKEVLRVFGYNCGVLDAQAKCWNDYKVLSTNSLEQQLNKDTLKITHHPDMHHEREFKYDDTQCEENGCVGAEDCFTSHLPSITAGRSAKEMKILGELVIKIANGDVDASKLDANTKAMVEALNEQDKQSSLFAALTDDDGALKVKMLKDIYVTKLEGTGVSVDHLLRIAGYDPSTKEGLDEDVDEKGFKRFLEPGCAE